MRFTHFNRRAAAFTLAGALAVGAVGVSFAQSPSGPSTPSAAAGERHGMPGDRLRGAGLKQIARASGLSEDVLKEGLRAGKSINQILTENGKDPATVSNAVLADLKARFDQAVRDGKLTQEKADKAYAAVQAALPRLFERVPDGSGRPGQERRRRVVGEGLIAAAANSIGIEPKELIKELRGGQTIAQVAQAHNVDPATVVADMTASANARIDALVQSGKVDAAKAAELKAKAAEHIARLVSEGRRS